MTTKKSSSKKNTDKPATTDIQAEEKVTIKQFIKTRKLPLYMCDIMGNYINKSEHEGFPKTVMRTIAEWDVTYSKMNSEKA